MERHFETSLRDLKQQLVGMAGYVEKAIDLAADVLTRRDPAQIEEIFAVEKEINKRHLAVDNASVTLLALQQPLAADLRLIVAVLKMNTDLERMGDQAVNIAYALKDLLARPNFRAPKDLLEMFTHAKFMVGEALDSFVQKSPALSRDVLKRDETVDALKNKIFRETVEKMKADPAQIDDGLGIILIARNLERIGDHATNIAEDVIFAATGEDIRHGYKVETLREALKK
ncbi:MAG TPA: phosphate transport system regulatory protein PhoU [Bdellovibrionales bacterium]|nr:MAG: phosphate transport system regulatory protein PhoU [Bdellovibrionales bacterium GWB1_52_6]OFZ03906.1 MAG: phosphate transport system regulatory protein PhoU [Bdellovibrionales bacterium GWA1_52_35]OFZ37400.1 MAG: phosphate transport system regulatory protein PhoU [Bdellovibrionales bacterium GWC1_52_8]HAR42721.1 phosphate transport system regulatory protein PhoU [Bdellovibrionales bacterium]HCM39655.1 phosphate transport system regulatory protein PhoU [Bdellovibrionales bacterium]